MDQLRAMRVFVKVADAGGFAVAARALDLAPAVVTRLVAELEEHLGARLLNRTTRRVALTEAGADYLQRARQILDDVAEAEAVASDATGVPGGQLRVLLPPALAVHQLAKHLPAFHKRYPQIRLALDSPGPVDTLDEAYDLTLLASRLPLEGDFIARRLARTEVVLCASPDYLDQHGRPRHPTELGRHQIMLPPISALQRGISFFAGEPGDPAARQEEVTLVPGQVLLTTAQVDVMYAAALHGLGMAGLPSFVAEDALLEQALERVLPEWRLFSLTLWAAMPSRKHLPVRTRVFLDFLLEVFGGQDSDPWLAAAGCQTRPYSAGLPEAGPSAYSADSADGR